MHEELRRTKLIFLILNCVFYLSVFSKCEHAHEIRIENIDFRVLRKILYKKKHVFNLSKFNLSSTKILLA